MHNSISARGATEERRPSDDWFRTTILLNEDKRDALRHFVQREGKEHLFQVLDDIENCTAATDDMTMIERFVYLYENIVSLGCSDISSDVTSYLGTIRKKGPLTRKMCLIGVQKLESEIICLLINMYISGTKSATKTFTLPDRILSLLKRRKTM
jgi:hypothetical protein